MIPVSDNLISDFCFVGDRSYIQGSELLMFLWDNLKLRYGIRDETQIKHFKQYAEVHKNLILTTESTNEFPVESILTYKYNQQWMQAFLIGTNLKIEKRIKNIITPITLKSHNDFSGEGFARKVSSFREMINSIIEINKQLHIHSLNAFDYDPKIRVVSIGNFNMFDINTETDLSVSIQLKRRRLFQGIEYTISHASISIGSFQQTMDLYYAFQERK